MLCHHRRAGRRRVVVSLTETLTDIQCVLLIGSTYALVTHAVKQLDTTAVGAMLFGMATIMNATETAEYLGVSRSTLWQWVRAGTFLPPSKPLSAGGPPGSSGGSTGGWYKSHVDRWAAVSSNRARLTAAHARRDAALSTQRTRPVGA